MACKSCQSRNQKVFESEMNIHFPELHNLNRGPVLAFPNLVICLDCGFAEFRIEDRELRELVEDDDDTKKAAG